MSSNRTWFFMWARWGRESQTVWGKHLDGMASLSRPYILPEPKQNKADY